MTPTRAATTNDATTNAAAPATTAAAAALVQDALRGKLALPMIPRVVREAMTLLRDPATSPHQLADKLSQDPVLCARVLRLANSPFYGGRRSIAAIDDAVTTIGTQALGTLVVASGVSAAFVEAPGVHLRDFWLHASVTAAMARHLALHSGADAEAAFLAGLLHEAGHLILCQASPAAARQAFGAHGARHGQALADAEQATFGVQHPQVSALWCDSLALPAAVGQAVGSYLVPGTGPDSRPATLLQLASRLAVAREQGYGADEALAQLNRPLAAQVGLDLDTLAPGIAALYSHLGQAGSLF